MGEKGLILSAVSGAESRTIVPEQQGSISFRRASRDSRFGKCLNHNPYNSVGVQKWD